MKKIIVATAVVFVLAIALIGCMIIFGALSMDYGLNLLLKVGAAVLLLGGCSALLSYLLNRNSE